MSLQLSNSQSTGSTDMPDFTRPPVNEVVCGVRFPSLEGWKTSHYGLYWALLKHEYPICDDQPPLSSQHEPEEGSAPIVIGPLPPLRRVWLIHQSNDYVLQIQPDRFLHNWRQSTVGGEYPHFGTAFSKFKSQLERFGRFVEEIGLPKPVPVGYELTYINHILQDDGRFPAELGRFINFYRWEGGAMLHQPSAASLDLSFPLPDNNGGLLVSVKHGHRKSDQKEIIVLDLTARGPSKGTSIGVDDWFQIAHEWIVRGFVDVTTPEAHALWGKTRG